MQLSLRALPSYVSLILMSVEMTGKVASREAFSGCLLGSQVRIPTGKDTKDCNENKCTL